MVVAGGSASDYFSGFVSVLVLRMMNCFRSIVSGGVLMGGFDLFVCMGLCNRLAARYTRVGLV